MTTDDDDTVRIEKALLSVAVRNADPLSAPSRNGAPPSQPAAGDIGETTLARAGVHAVLESLQGQAVQALSLPFFDDGVLTESVPPRKSGLSEVSGVTVRALRRDPRCCATLTIEIRVDLRPTDRGRDSYRIACQLHCESATQTSDSPFAMTVAIDNVDGSLRLDHAQIRGGLAAAVGM